MNVKIILFCILFSRSSASFFDEFRGAMLSVENSFGKLVNDVVTDVKDTIGCTILAVKQVLALGGIFHESSEYNARCRGINDSPSYIQDKSGDYTPAPTFIFTTPSVSEKSLSEKLSKEIDQSVTNVNPAIFDLVSKSDSHERNIHDASDLLSKLNALLREELSKMSGDIKIELRKVEPDINNPDVHHIWSSIRALHDIELNHRDTAEATEVHHILNEVLSVLRGNKYDDSVTIESANKNDTDAMFTEIKTQFVKIEEESKDTDTIEGIESDSNNKNVDNSLKTTSSPLTFRDVAKQIMDETSRTLDLVDDTHMSEELLVTSTEKTTTTTVEANNENKYDAIESPDYAAIFQLPPEDIHSRKEAAKEAHLLIEKSKETDAIMKKYFEQSSNAGTSVFDDPDYFTF